MWITKKGFGFEARRIIAVDGYRRRQTVALGESPDIAAAISRVEAELLADQQELEKFLKWQERGRHSLGPMIDHRRWRVERTSRRLALLREFQNCSDANQKVKV